MLFLHFLVVYVKIKKRFVGGFSECKSCAFAKYAKAQLSHSF